MGRNAGLRLPLPVRDYAFSSQGEALTMRYMDVAPSAPAKGRTAVLLHGKNFCAATWEDTIRALSGAGYRVIAPDQIGFCKSSKPERYQYSFHQLAENTHALLESLGVKDPVLIAHSTGGMIAGALCADVSGQRLGAGSGQSDGLEDWKALGVPTLSVDQWIEREKATTAERIKAYEQTTYYAGAWRPKYDRWVTMLAGLVQGPGHAIVARNLGLIDDNIYTQPVIYQFPRIRVPTL